jgi:hypothetical protein
MSFSPMPAVVEARKAKALGELNLTPYPAQCGNAAAWLRRVFAVANTPWCAVSCARGLAAAVY